MVKQQFLNARTAEQWAEIIQSKWQDSVKGIMDVGITLANAREELGATEFWVMVREKLRYSKFTVSALKAIGTDVRLMELFPNNLPASWTMLYDLTKLTDEQLERGITSGIIHAGMERKDIALLKPPKDGSAAKDMPTGQELVEHRIMDLRQQFVRTLRKLKPAEQVQYLDLLQFQLNDLRAKLEKEAA